MCPLRIDTGEAIVLVATPRTPGVVRGPVGPAGPPGVGAEGYIHTQSSPASEWTVNHNLGYYPIIEALSPGRLAVVAEIQHVSVNQALVRFVSDQTGTAIAR